MKEKMEYLEKLVSNLDKQVIVLTKICEHNSKITKKLLDDLTKHCLSTSEDLKQ